MPTYSVSDLQVWPWSELHLNANHRSWGLQNKFLLPRSLHTPSNLKIEFGNLPGIWLFMWKLILLLPSFPLVSAFCYHGLIRHHQYLRVSAHAFRLWRANRRKWREKLHHFSQINSASVNGATVQLRLLLVTAPAPDSNRVCLFPSTNKENTHVTSLGRNIALL